MWTTKLIGELTIFLSCLLPGCSLLAQDAETRPVRKSSEAKMPLAEVVPDKKIPTLEQVVKHSWGENISSHAEVELYIRDLVRAAPLRTKLKKYGTSYEGRALYYLVISSPANIRRIDEIRENNLLLSDPRRGSAQEENGKEDPAECEKHFPHVERDHESVEKVFPVPLQVSHFFDSDLDEESFFTFRVVFFFFFVDFGSPDPPFESVM